MASAIVPLAPKLKKGDFSLLISLPDVLSLVNTSYYILLEKSMVVTKKGEGELVLPFGVVDEGCYEAKEYFGRDEA